MSRSHSPLGRQPKKGYVSSRIITSVDPMLDVTYLNPMWKLHFGTQNDRN
jgi:hypothetical protein